MVEVTDIENVAVLGAGNMGHGITEVVAMAGYEVTMRDIEDEYVENGYENIEWSLNKLDEKDRLNESPDDVLNRIETTTDLAAAVEGVDLVIEAAPEQLSIKCDVFEELAEVAPDDALLATNTSSLSITEIQAAADDPSRVVGMHFFNPPVKMALVEVIYGAETSDEAAETAYEFVETLDKTPIYVRKDVNGFVVNSVLGPFMDEPAWMVSNDEATIREADAAMVHERGYPMGPFELADLTGIDVGYHVRKEAGKDIPPFIQEKVDAEELGRKTGEGYYVYENGPGPDYEPEDADDFDTLRVEARMINEAAKLIGNDVATPDAVDTGMRLGAGFPEGPCARADKLGLDVVLEKLRSLLEETGEERFDPADYLVELVEAGETGTDAGKGFYEYTTEGLGDYHYLNADLDDRGVLTVELDRPERLNALSRDLMEEIEHVLDHAPVDDVRCVVFEGAGDRAFSAGADVTGFAETKPTEMMEVTPVFVAVDDFPRPTIAKVRGYCLGGGLELALACDLRVATEDAQFGAPEIGLGLIPGGGGTQRLLRILGETRAKELVFRGNRIDADSAENWGLINRAVSEDDFEDTVAEFVDDLAGGPPIALKIAKQVMNDGRDVDLDAGLRLESQGFGLLFSTEDAREGTAAFAEDRDPEFTGE